MLLAVLDSARTRRCPSGTGRCSPPAAGFARAAYGERSLLSKDELAPVREANRSRCFGCVRAGCPRS
jgi:hypothetical protein